MSIGETIKRLRELHGISQADLAQIVGVTSQAVSTWETDLRLPRMGAVEKMAAYFGVTKSEIIDEVPSNAATYDLFNRLSSDDQQKALDYIKLLYTSKLVDKRK